MPQQPATSLMVANLLVIVSFVYRYFRGGSGTDLDQPMVELGAEFTTVVDLSQLTVGRSWSMANGVSRATDAITSIQKGSVSEAVAKSTQLSSSISPSH